MFSFCVNWKFNILFTNTFCCSVHVCLFCYGGLTKCMKNGYQKFFWNDCKYSLAYNIKYSNVLNGILNFEVLFKRKEHINFAQMKSKFSLHFASRQKVYRFYFICQFHTHVFLSVLSIRKNIFTIVKRERFIFLNFC